MYHCTSVYKITFFSVHHSLLKRFFFFRWKKYIVLKIKLNKYILCVTNVVWLTHLSFSLLNFNMHWYKLCSMNLDKTSRALWMFYSFEAGCETVKSEFQIKKVAKTHQHAAGRGRGAITDCRPSSPPCLHTSLSQYL